MYARRRIPVAIVFAPSLLVAVFSASALAGEWPQILGPQRDGRATGEKIADAWPKTGPKVVWSYKVGSGFAGPAVISQRVIVFHRVGDQERIEALSTVDGKSLWKTDFDATYRGGINPDDGPRCVPLVHQGNVYVYGAAGDLHSVELATGKKRWSRAANSDYAAPEGYFGAGSTPIVIGDSLLVNVGGRDGTGIVAFALADGKTRWKGVDDTASYSSPIVLEFDGKPRALFVTRLNMLVVDPATGEVLAQTPFGMRGPTVNAASPILVGDSIFLTASYGIGARLLDVKPSGVKALWESDDVLSSQYNTPVYDKGYLYGIHGREDAGLAELRCIDAKSQKVAWSESDFGVAHLILADGKLLILKNDGGLVLARATPTKFEVLAKATAFSDTVRALPALANGKLYARDGAALKCFDVAK